MYLIQCLTGTCYKKLGKKLDKLFEISNCEFPPVSKYSILQCLLVSMYGLLIVDSDGIRGNLMFIYYSNDIYFKIMFILNINPYNQMLE